MSFADESGKAIGRRDVGDKQEALSGAVFSSVFG